MASISTTQPTTVRACRLFESGLYGVVSITIFLLGNALERIRGAIVIVETCRMQRDRHEAVVAILVGDEEIGAAPVAGDMDAPKATCDINCNPIVVLDSRPIGLVLGDSDPIFQSVLVRPTDRAVLRRLIEGKECCVDRIVVEIAIRRRLEEAGKIYISGRGQQSSM